jgi:hypothetical protein
VDTVWQRRLTTDPRAGTTSSSAKRMVKFPNGIVVPALGHAPGLPAAVLSDDPMVTQSRLNSRRFSNRLSMSLPFSWCLRGQNYGPPLCPQVCPNWGKS